MFVQAMRTAKDILDRLTEIRDELREIRAQTGGWDTYAQMLHELADRAKDHA